MSLKKNNNHKDGMRYELDGNKSINPKRAAKNAAKSLNTFVLLGIILNRHKVGLLIATNIFWAVNYAVPEWPSIVKSLIVS